MKVAVLGPGGVGGLIAGLLERDRAQALAESTNAVSGREPDTAVAGGEVIVVAQESTAAVIARDGLHVQSVTFGDFTAHPRAVARLQEPVDALIVATKAAGLAPALERIAVEPRVVLPLLNGLDHLTLLRERFTPGTVLAGSIRVEADRPAPGVIVHTSPFLLVSMAGAEPAVHPAMQALADTLSHAGVPIKVQDSEADVMWSKLVRLNALACTTSAYDVLLGEIRSTPALRADLEGAITEACAVGQAEGATDIDPARAIAELEAAHATLGSSMQRDIAAGREPELDAIPGSVLRAGARHSIPCPTIERLVAMINARLRTGAPVSRNP